MRLIKEVFPDKSLQPPGCTFDAYDYATFGKDVSDQDEVEGATCLNIAPTVDGRTGYVKRFFLPTQTLMFEKVIRFASLAHADSPTSSETFLAFSCPYNGGQTTGYKGILLQHVVSSDPATFRLRWVQNNDSAYVTAITHATVCDLDAWYRVRVFVDVAAATCKLQVAEWTEGAWVDGTAVTHTGTPGDYGVQPFSAVSWMAKYDSTQCDVDFADCEIRSDAAYDTDLPGVWNVEPYDPDTLKGTGKVLVVTDRDDCDVTVEYCVEADTPAWDKTATLLLSELSDRAHRFQFTDLVPGESYLYRVKIDDGVLAETTVGDASNKWCGNDAWGFTFPSSADVLHIGGAADTQGLAYLGGNVVAAQAKDLYSNSRIGRPSVFLHGGDNHENISGGRAPNTAYLPDWCVPDWVAEMEITPYSWKFVWTGNHDDADGSSHIYAALSSADPTASGYKRNRIGHTELFALNYPGSGAIPAAQLAWLEAALADSTATTKLVGNHVQLLGTPADPATPNNEPPSNASDLFDICIAAGVKLVVWAHTHRIGLHYYEGTGGGIWCLNLPRLDFGTDANAWEGYTVEDAEVIGQEFTRSSLSSGSALAARGYASIMISPKGGLLVRVWLIDDPGSAYTRRLAAQASIGA